MVPVCAREQLAEIAMGVGDRAKRVAGDAGAVVEGVQGAFDAIAKTTGDKGRAALTAATLASCFGEKLKSATNAAASLKANVDVSVNVRATASASGSTR
jgi:hypothetical protein